MQRDEVAEGGACRWAARRRRVAQPVGTHVSGQARIDRAVEQAQRQGEREHGNRYEQQIDAHPQQQPVAELDLAEGARSHVGAAVAQVLLLGGARKEWWVIGVDLRRIGVPGAALGLPRPWPRLPDHAEGGRDVGAPRDPRQVARLLQLALLLEHLQGPEAEGRRADPPAGAGDPDLPRFGRLHQAGEGGDRRGAPAPERVFPPLIAPLTRGFPPLGRIELKDAPVFPVGRFAHRSASRSRSRELISSLR